MSTYKNKVLDLFLEFKDSEEVRRVLLKCISVTGEKATEVEISQLHVVYVMLAYDTSYMTSNSNTELLITFIKTVLLPGPTKNTVVIQA